MAECRLVASGESSVNADAVEEGQVVVGAHIAPISSREVVECLQGFEALEKIVIFVRQAGMD